MILHQFYLDCVARVFLARFHADFIAGGLAASETARLPLESRNA